MQNKLMKPFKKMKGGLSALITAVFLIIIAVLVFYSAIHPTANVIKEEGQNAGTRIITEDGAMTSEFAPVEY
ncbi:hypothetical protein [Clostridium tyrobutyricum]|jgi:hypothetical protein|uniref:hypothetical protein n=1 Tax=Clostridium tyrobutyricum TaxID=1519 RepID=UPI00242B8475|nr:hypothetical protein [Clostridium tyrobutyricum]